MEKTIVFGIDLSGANPALFAALAKAQGSMSTAKKGSINSHFRNRYADLASVLEAILPPMNANGLALLQFPGNEGAQHVSVSTLITHSDGGWIASQASCKADKDNAQGFGSAVSYLKRYSAQAALACPSEDDDGNSASGLPPKPVKTGAVGPGMTPPDSPKKSTKKAKPAAPSSSSTSSSPPRKLGPPDACPECDSKMWDNRDNKISEKSPDFKCKDAQCGKAIWLPKADFPF